MKKISVYVTQARIKQGLTQEKLAEKAEISRRQLARIEEGVYDNKKLTVSVKALLKTLDLEEGMFLPADVQKRKAEFSKLATQIEDAIFREKYTEAEQSLQQMLKKYSPKELADEENQRLLMLKGSLLMIKGAHSDSLELLLEALSMTQMSLVLDESSTGCNLNLAEIETASLARQEYDIIREIATALARNGKYKQAIEIYQSILKSFEASHLDTIIVERFTPTILYNIAYTYDKMGEPDQALAYAQQTVNYCETTGNHRILAPAKDLHQKFIVLFSPK